MKRPPVLLLMWLVLSLPTSQLFAESRPNFVFILADDLGYCEVGYNGQKLIRTPNEIAWRAKAWRSPDTIPATPSARLRALSS